MRTIRLNEMNVTAREIEIGYLTPLPRDPSADPPDMAGCRLPRLTRPDEPKERKE